MNELNLMSTIMSRGLKASYRTYSFVEHVLEDVQRVAIVLRRHCGPTAEGASSECPGLVLDARQMGVMSRGGDSNADARVVNLFRVGDLLLLKSPVVKNWWMVLQCEEAAESLRVPPRR